MREIFPISHSSNEKSLSFWSGISATLVSSFMANQMDIQMSLEGILISKSIRVRHLELHLTKKNENNFSELCKTNKHRKQFNILGIFFITR